MNNMLTNIKHSIRFIIIMFVFDFFRVFDNGKTKQVLKK